MPPPPPPSVPYNNVVADEEDGSKGEGRSHQVWFRTGGTMAVPNIPSCYICLDEVIDGYIGTLLDIQQPTGEEEEEKEEE